MSDRRKEAEEKMAKAIFISADCWLCVFDLLPPSQLGLGISMISHRFDFYVDEHFKTRKWALKSMRIWRIIRKKGKKEMGIFNFDRKTLPVPQIQLPRKIIGFERINITYIDHNVITFLGHFCPLFASRPINLSIYTWNDRNLESILHNILPMLGKNIHGLELSTDVFHHLRQFVPSILSNYPSLRVFSISVADFFTEFPADENANASDGQAVAKWLFTPLQENDVPKAFASASSPVNFIVIIRFIPLSFAFSVHVPFDLTNELTREQLALKRINNSDCFLLIRCPIARDESKWTKWEKDAIGWKLFDQWNRINIHICKDEIGDGLLDAMPGPSDQPQN